MAESMHINGSWVGDSVEEFKKLPLWGKIVLAVVVVVVVYFAIKARGKSAQQATGASLQSTTAGNTPGTTSPFPMVGNLPVLPSGTNPVYDPNGGLIGYQSTSPSQSSPWSALLVRASGSQGTTDYDKAHPEGVPVRATPGGTVTGFAAYGSPIQTTGGPVTAGSNIGAGKGSNVWYQLSNGGYISQYDLGALPTKGVGGGDRSMMALMEDPFKYLIASTPRLPSTVPTGR